MRKAGVLLAISSLPSQYGIGDLGTSAYEFVNILKTMKAKIWQVLPLTPMGFGNSPYQSSSSFAGDEIYISIDLLVKDNLLNISDVSNFNQYESVVEYDIVRQFKNKLLKLAYGNFKLSNDAEIRAEYDAFVLNNPWLSNYAIFKTFSKVNNNQIWTEWSSEYKNWIKDKFIDISQYQDDIDYEIFLQFIFYRQWFAIKRYANSNGIEIMGDLPIYAGLDSVDVWANQSMFLLDDSQRPTFVAGVPPDFFSETGQLWGNPIYDWDNLKANGFEFWIERLKANFNLFDILRIDHFRAFDTYWKIPASSKTAINGEWVEAPGYAFFDAVYAAIPDANIVAEDLGDLREEVFELRDHYNLKGMKVFHFHLNPSDKKSVHEFHDIENIIVYTGTHDNNTTRGWYDEQTKWFKKSLKKYLKANDRNICDKIIKYSLSTDAEIVIIPAQDIIGLDESARINTPGTVGTPNWEWKLSNFDDLESKSDWMANQIVKSGR